MTRDDQLEIFKAQTKNVKTLDKAWDQLVRNINKDLTIDNYVSANLHTKLLALIFSAWSEATFSKLIHTPHGLELQDIDQIKAEANRNIVHGWRKCLELGLQKIAARQKSNYIPNIKQAVERIIIPYVEGPRLLRNKIAHGQWDICLNVKNTAINPETTANLHHVNVVTLTIWKQAHLSLSGIIEVLVESPDRAFHRDYWNHTVALETMLTKTEEWTLEKRVARLKEKKQYFQPSR